jgi:hypothetical protein
VANPIKIQYRDAFRFAPFSIEDLEIIVRNSLSNVASKMAIKSEIDNLQCFSPAYPNPPHIIRETVESV